MADRIIGMRTTLRENLENLGSPLPWNHITNQVQLNAQFLNHFFFFPLLIVVAWGVLSPSLNFYGYLETKYLGTEEGYIFYWRIELLTSLSHKSVKNLVGWVFKQVSVTISADWHVLLQRDDTRTGWSFDKRVSYLHDS